MPDTVANAEGTKPLSQVERVVDTFIGESDLAAFDFCRRGTGSNRSSLVPSGHPAPDLICICTAI